MHRHGAFPSSGATVLRHRFPEYPAVGASLQAFGVSSSASSMYPFTTASTMASHLSSRAWSFSLGSPGSTSGAQTQPAVTSPVSSAELPIQVSVSDEVSMPDEKEEFTERCETVAAAVFELTRGIGEQLPVPCDPEEFTTGNTSPLSPPPRTSTISAESAAAVGVRMTKEVGPSHELSPTLQEQPDEEVRAVVTGLTSSVPGEDFQRTQGSTIASPQASPQSHPQPPQISPPPREPDEDCTPNDARPSLLPTAVGDSKISVRPSLAEAEGQDRSSTHMATSGRSTQHIVGFVAAAAAAVTETAAANDETKVEDTWQDRSATPKPIPARSAKSVVGGSGAGSEAGAKPGAREETKRRNRTPFGFLNMSENVSCSRVSPCGDSAHPPPLGGLEPQLAEVSYVPGGPAILPAKVGKVNSAARYLRRATTGSVEVDDARRAGATAIGTQSTSLSHLPMEEKEKDGETQMTFTEAADEFWDRAKKDQARAKLNTNLLATRIAELAKGRPPISIKRDIEGCDLFDVLV